MNIEIISDVAVSPNLAAGATDVCCAYALTMPVADGSLLTIYRQGATKHSSDGVLTAQRSADGAEWEPPVVVFDGRETAPTLTPVTGGGVTLADGSQYVVFAAVEGLAADTYMFSAEGRKLPRRILACRSRDDGATWSSPAAVPTGELVNAGITGRPVTTANGRLCVSLEHRTAAGSQGTALMVSADGGEQFTAPTTVAADPQGDLNLCDGRMTLLPDGRLLMLLWTFRQGDEETLSVHQTVSTDDGDSWSLPEPIGLVGQVTVPAALPSGQVLAASNVRVAPQGSQLWSADPGLHWRRQALQMWDPDGGRIVARPLTSPAPGTESGQGVWQALQDFTFGTPDLAVLPDQTIVLTYYATLKGVTHIRACRCKVLEGVHRNATAVTV